MNAIDRAVERLQRVGICRTGYPMDRDGRECFYIALGRTGYEIGQPSSMSVHQVVEAASHARFGAGTIDAIGDPANSDEDIFLALKHASARLDEMGRQ